MNLYVGTYHKYNCGSIFGKWLDLDDFSNSDEFYEKCRKIHADEEDPEFMFQDYEGEEWEGKLYSECSAPSEYWDIKKALEKFHLDDEVFSAWLTASGNSPSVEQVEKAADCYMGEKSLEDYLEEYHEEVGDIPDNLKFYIDYERMARDYSSEFYEENGFLFCA